MHLKLKSPSPTNEISTTTEITLTIEIVMSLVTVLFFKWIAHINYIEMITDLCLYTITLKPID